MEKKTYDPLRLTIKQKENERGAYKLGYEKGKEEGDNAHQDDLYKWRDWMVNRVLDVEELDEKSFLSKMSSKEGYLAALEDVLKMISPYLK